MVLSPQATPRAALAVALLLLALAACSAQYTDEDGSRPKEYGIYCGKENCYEVLGVTPDATEAQIKKVYRKLARDLHPDRNKGEDAKEKFQRVAAAYEALRDEESRKDYDYLLAHPDEYYRNLYRYFKGKAAPKLDVLPILVVLLIVVSVFQVPLAAQMLRNDSFVAISAAVLLYVNG